MNNPIRDDRHLAIDLPKIRRNIERNIRHQHSRPKPMRNRARIAELEARPVAISRRDLVEIRNAIAIGRASLQASSDYNADTQHGLATLYTAAQTLTRALDAR